MGVTSTSSSVFVKFTFLDLKQLTQDRNISDSRNLAEFHGRAMVQQTGNSETLTVLQFDLGFSPPGRNCRQRESRNDDRVGIVERS